MPISCLIEYKINPCQLEAFTQYAQAWGQIVPKCGGNLLGYFLPYEENNRQAYGLISFDSLSDDQAYRDRLKSDCEGRANFEFARRQRFIVSEKRVFLSNIPETMVKVSSRFEKAGAK